MYKNLIKTGIACSAALITFTSCNDQEFVNENVDAKRVEVTQITPELAKVRDYVPLYAVVAHRGSTFWAPEETESAWRWAREMGVDYLESDLQCTKDGIVLANHDENLKRTTDIENVYSETVPAGRVQFYESLGFSHDDAVAQYNKDVESFRPYYTMSYYYHELLALDAGSWFNETSMEQAREGFVKDKQCVSALQDQIAYAEGKKLKREEVEGRNVRVLNYTIKEEYKGKTLEEIRNAKGKYLDIVDYDFANAYVDDDQDTGNRPGIYIEFKETWLNPKDMVQRVYNVLADCGWNIMEKPAAETEFYKDGKVNVGKTNGKVILQTFSFDALISATAVFKGEVPMCYLLWEGSYSTDITYATPTGYADFINMAIQNKAHILGPSIAGAPNNYPELNQPWQAYMIRKSGLLNHPYSFDSYAQLAKHMGLYNYGVETEFDDLLKISIPSTEHTTFSGTTAVPVYMDGSFTNRSEISLRYMVENGFRCNANLPNPFHAGQKYDNSQAPSEVPDPATVLQDLGYTK